MRGPWHEELPNALRNIEFDSAGDLPAAEAGS